MRRIIHWASPDIGEEEVRAVAESVRSGWVGGNGPLVKEFEREFARIIGVRHAIAVNNGTSALLCALQALRSNYERKLMIGVPTFTFIATANTAREIGTIHLLDCDRRTWNISPSSIYHGLTDETIDILMPVDVAGLPVDYDSLKKFGIAILADSAEATGAKYKGKMVGSQALVHTFSFHSAKIITTGEGGMITTNDNGLYELMYSIVNQGYGKVKKSWEYYHPNIGFNYRMAEPLAALGLVQLKKLNKYVIERNNNARIYKDILGDLVGYQEVPRNCLHPYFAFGILVENQVSLCRRLYHNGIEVKAIFRPIHKQPPYYSHNQKDFDNADWISERVVSLPIYNGITEETVKYIAETVKKMIR